MKIPKRIHIILLLTIILSSCISPCAYARTAYVDRVDIGIVEEVRVAIQAAEEIYMKYVVSYIDKLKSITGLQELTKNINELIALKDKAFSQFSSLDLNSIMPLNELTKLQNEKFNEILGSTGSIDSGFIDNIMGFLNEGSINASGLVGAILSGKNDSVSYYGASGSLSDVANKQGLRKAAEETISRSNQVYEKASEKASSSGGNDVENALLSAIGYITKAVPLTNSPTLDAYLESMSYTTQSAKEQISFITYLSDYAKAAPMSQTVEILDKYLSDKSPYEKTKYEEQLHKEMEDIANQIVAADEDDASPQNKMSLYLAAAIKQNELLMRQYEDIIEIAGDGVKQNTITASLKATTMAGTLRDNIFTRTNIVSEAPDEMKIRYMKEAGITSGGKP